MHILFVTPMLPSTMGGARTRTFNLIKHLSARRRVSVLSFMQPGERDWVDALRPYCHQLQLIPIPAWAPPSKWGNRLLGWKRLLTDRRPPYARTFPVDQMREPLHKLLASEAVDVIHFEHLFVAELLPVAGGRPAVLDEHNVESEVCLRSASLEKDPLHRLRDTLALRRLQAFEQYWVRRFPVCLAVSNRDANVLSEMGSPAVHVVPNGVDVDYFCRKSAQMAPREGLLFVGTMDYKPNVDGVVHFCKEILPLIRQRSPNVAVTIVGAEPGPEVMKLGKIPGVHITGSVEDVRPYLWRACASVVPLRIGGGTRFKILESLAAGCPVVSTTLGAEGLELEPGQHLLVADTADTFADFAVRLLEDASERDRLALAGSRAVAETYAWRHIIPRLEVAYEAARKTGLGNRS